VRANRDRDLEVGVRHLILVEGVVGVVDGESEPLVLVYPVKERKGTGNNERVLACEVGTANTRVNVEAVVRDPRRARNGGATRHVVQRQVLR
jgi:hypothetical protein